jgi:hypothetical protein
MAEPGLKAFAARGKQRTGIYSFEPMRPGLSAKFKKLFRANPPAWEFFTCQAPWYQRTAGHRVGSAKHEETRMRRLAKLMDVPRTANGWINSRPKRREIPKQPSEQG